MTEILLIRHGETAWNAQRRLQGHLDIPLNEVGVRQARALARSLDDEQLDAVFASDLQRARQTAQAIAEARGMTVTLDRGLRERCYGAFEGLLHTEVKDRYPEAYMAWKARDVDARFPPGVHVAETTREFAQRTVSAILGIVAGGAYRRIAIVCHGGVLECAYRAAQDMDFGRPRDFDILNASINRFSSDGKSLRLLQWGDVKHLESLDAAALDELVK